MVLLFILVLLNVMVYSVVILVVMVQIFTLIHPNYAHVVHAMMTLMDVHKADYVDQVLLLQI